MKSVKSQPLKVAIEYFNAWSNKEYDKASNFLSEKITLDMPINSYENKQEFMKAVKFTSDSALGTTLVAQFENNDEALLLYELEFAQIGKIRIAEHFKIKDGQIFAISHTHDTAPFRYGSFNKQTVI